MHIYYSLFIVSLFLCCQPKTPKSPYNIIYISLEDLSPYLGCYGDSIVQSPHIDTFSKTAMLFEQAHCQVALCTPSRTSILTGVRPASSGIVKIDDNWREMLPSAVSLPRHFKNNGYYTHAIGKISDSRNGGMDDAWHVKEEHWGIKDNEHISRVLQTLKSQDQPFLFAVGYKQTHDVWEPARQHLRKYDKTRIQPRGTGKVYKKEERSAQEIQDLLHRYYASIMEVDSLIGDLLHQLKSMDLMKHSIIVFGALDHGYSLGLHNKWGKGDNYDNETHVPLFIRIPDHINNGKRSAGLVELVDIYPTLIDYCNLPNPPQELEGYSLRSLIDVPEQDWKQVIFTHRAYHLDEVGIKSKRYNLILENGIPTQLFDRQKDPNNMINIMDDYPKVVQEMMKWKALNWKEALPK